MHRPVRREPATAPVLRVDPPGSAERNRAAGAYQPTVMVATVGLVPISDELNPRTSSYGNP